METSLLVIFTFLLLFGLSSNTMVLIAASSNVTCIERERQSLLEFKHSLIDTYNFLSTWGGAECCKWKGVGCDSRNGHVVKLDLRTSVDSNLNDMMLGGNVSPLQNLKHLRYLDLSMNNFSGNIPEFLGSLTRLRYLNLSCSGFEGLVPHHLGNLSRLEYLDLKNTVVMYDSEYDYFNTNTYSTASMDIDDLGWLASLSSLRHLDLSAIIIGTHVDWFHPINMLPSLLTLNLGSTGINNLSSVKRVNFTSLNSLDLSDNDIHSTMPVWLSNLTNLMHLNLGKNAFHGKVPDFVGMFSNLALIDFSFSFFESLIPDSLCNLSSLIHLKLSFNQFSGQVPANIGLLSRLERLSLQGNQLSGDIPTSVWKLSNLKILCLSDNSFVGNIPTSLGNFSNLIYLDLSYTSLGGFIFENHFTKLTKLNVVRFSWSLLELSFSSQWIPPFQLRVFSASSCKIGPRFPNWLQTQTNLGILELSNSSISDKIPELFEKILFHIRFLDLSNNQISGRLPRLDGNSSNQYRVLEMRSNKFEGTLSTFPANVAFLDLSDNLLSGHLPQTGGTMNTGVEHILLSKNHITGSIPVDLCRVSTIIALDLSDNKLSGTIPECLGNLTNLGVLDLANNNITGLVPSSLGSLKNLLTLHLENNRLEGVIPVSLQKLTKLSNMDLGNNLFVGNIPFWIGENFSKLRFLNLESNKHTGKIPLQLCQLGSLQYLNLAHNNITGTIPRCFGNLNGMKNASLREMYTFSYGVYYEEYVFAFLKGMQLQYTSTKKFLKSLDLSNNNVVGEIPDALMNLVQLKNLNLSRNLLRGHIPKIIGNLKQLESLDLSMNKLSGQIPQSLTSLNFLSYMNLSYNNLSGPIPVGNQIQTLVDPSIYKENKGLCGPLVSRKCNGNSVLYNRVDENEGNADTDGLWFYAGMGPGFAVGLLGLVGSLLFIKSWRVVYFERLEMLMVSITLVLAGLRRKIFE